MNKNKKNWPIIVGGVYRSGTSLVRRILNAHSNIYCGPEVKFFRDFYNDYIADPLRHIRFFESARSILPEKDLLLILGKSFVEMHQLAAKVENKPRWADKNPDNVLYLDKWTQLLGDEWLFVQVVRNPLDTLTSIGEANFNLTIPSDLSSRIGLYKAYSEAGLMFSLEHPQRSYRILYERLVTSPQEEIDKLMYWLSEKSEINQISFNFAVHQLGLEDPKVKYSQRIHNDSVGRWKGFLSASEVDLILNETGELWKKLDHNNDYPL